MATYRIKVETREGHTGRDHLLKEYARRIEDEMGGHCYATAAAARRGAQRTALSLARRGRLFVGLSQGLVYKPGKC
jgi:hypothetical protein